MNKLKVVVAGIGIFAGLGGATHGPGEILQGNVAPGRLFIKAWPGLTALGGEPAMTVIPNFFTAGVITIIFGIIVAIWAGKYLQSKLGGLILTMLSVALLLVGGGIVPPFFGVAAGLVGITMNYRAAKHGDDNQ